MDSLTQPAAQTATVAHLSTGGRGGRIAARLNSRRMSENQAPIAKLALADGTVFTGQAFGYTDAAEPVGGEVVFNTSMTGYQEMLTDPSYHGQILCLTTSHVGQVGVNALDAVIQTFNGINAMRQHIKDGARIHGIISNGGAKPNIVPERPVNSLLWNTDS